MKIAVCAIIPDEKGNILSVSRKNDHEDWGLPGGKYDPEDRSLEDCIIRECLEETGYHIEIIDPLYFKQQDNDFIVYTFICKLKSDDKEMVSELETGKVDFINPSYLLKGSFKEYNKNCFKFFNIN